MEYLPADPLANYFIDRLFFHALNGVREATITRNQKTFFMRDFS